jgi:hypothetical protein
MHNIEPNLIKRKPLIIESYLANSRCLVMLSYLSESHLDEKTPPLSPFLILPAMTRNGMSFWLAVSVSCAITVILYLLSAWLLNVRP